MARSAVATARKSLPEWLYRDVEGTVADRRQTFGNAEKLDQFGRCVRQPPFPIQTAYCRVLLEKAEDTLQSFQFDVAGFERHLCMVFIGMSQRHGRIRAEGLALPPHSGCDTGRSRQG